MDSTDVASENATGGARVRGRKQAALLAGVVLAASLALTLAAAWNAHRVARASALEAFGQQLDHLKDDIEEHLKHPAYGLAGARAAWLASPTLGLDRAGFRRHVEARDLPREFPGMLGIGFIERVQRPDLDTFVASARADQAPAFAVRTTGNAPDLYVIKYIEPAASNLQAMGYDVGADASRRAAMVRAVRTGLPSLTGPVTLVQATGSGAGLLLAMPVYRYGANPTTPEQRARALVGLVFAPLVVTELLRDHGTFNNINLDYELADTTPDEPRRVLHRLGAEVDHTPNTASTGRWFVGTRTFPVNGRTWTVRAGSTPAFQAARADTVPGLITALGTVISALLALLVWHLGTRRAGAEALAQNATAELAVERQRLADIIDGANIATWERDIPSGTARFDERWAGELGYTLKELGPTSFDKFVTMMHPDDVPGMNDALARHFAGETPYYQCEYRVRHKDGHWLWMLVRGSVSAWDGPGRPRTISGMRMNITDRKAAQAALADANAVLEERVAKRTAQLQRAVRDLEDFSYSIAHDIRQPLISLDGFSRLLARELGAQPTAEATHYLERLRAGVRQISDLSDGLLALAHVSTAPLNRQAVDLTTLAREVFAARHRREPARPATAHIAEGLVAHGDREQLRKLLAILIDNAFKFSRDQTAVDVSVTMETDGDGREVFHVTDRGTGFDMAHAGRMFEPFQRLHPQTEFPGMGIGLASAHRIVARHNGTIWADATPGTGARFSFTLGAPGSSSSQIGA